MLSIMSLDDSDVSSREVRVMCMLIAAPASKGRAGWPGLLTWQNLVGGGQVIFFYQTPVGGGHDFESFEVRRVTAYI